MASKKIELRTEADAFGQVALPASAYWGAQTARAIESSIKVPALNPRFLEGLLLFHKAAAHANVENGLLDPAIGRCIGQAVDETLAGQWQDQFPLNFMQAGAMLDLLANAREFLANRAGEILGAPPGSYQIVRPFEHMGIGIDSYDAFSTILRISLLLQEKDLQAALRDLERLLRRKALEFERHNKSCNSQSIESSFAAPEKILNGLGAEIARVCKRLLEAGSVLLELNLSERAFRTADDTTSSGKKNVQAHIEKLSAYTGLALRGAEDYQRLRQSVNDFAELSSALKLIALSLAKTASELRSMQSMKSPERPAELYLPADHLSFQGARTSIPEFVSMLSYQIVGLDTANSLICQNFQSAENGTIALLAQNLLHSMELLRQTLQLFNKRCLQGIQPCDKIAVEKQSREYTLSLV
ncbi:MAG: hypothetical protein K2X27_12270 [Candidatus Obscuribacterales bacterium]|nr:hypothetical protein [Candidatus Obscuribacterales bacterium]